jgi:LacI family transcriptional regulator
MKKSNMLGLIVPNVSFSYYANIAAVAEQVFYRYGYTMFLCITKYLPSLEERYVNVLLENKVDGILIGSSLKTKSLYKKIRDKKVPFVCIDEASGGEVDAPSVNVDHELGVDLMVSHLYEKGARRIVYVHAPMDLGVLNVRLRAFEKSARALGLDPEVVLIQIPQISYYESGYEVAHLLLSRLSEFDAIFAETDEIAIGISVFLKENGIKIPEDIMLAGYDGAVLGKISSPLLTTVDQNISKLGYESAKMLIDRIGNCNVSDHLLLSPVLVLGESTQSSKTAK